MQRSLNMAAVRRTNTKPELVLRSALHSLGLRYRVDYPIRLQSKLIRPDIVFTRWRVAVFIDGCFWHMCPVHGEIPATNVGFWKAKLEGNASRDRQQTLMLAQAGWVVVRIWEHESLADALATVQRAVESQRQSNMP